jgi:4-hydroxy-tetrahydrodipicolinate synthase
MAHVRAHAQAQAQAPAIAATHNRDFSGLWIPLITPFKNGDVDHPALGKLVRHYATCGIAGFVACGSTGEAAALDDSEQLAVLKTILAAAGDLPVIMGLSGYHLPQTLEWVRTLGQFALAGLLVPAPHYIRPSQDGLLHWFTALADASVMPLVIYDIPYRTGVHLHLETLLKLAEHPNIAGIKDCGGDAAKTHALIADGRLQVLAGEDAQTFTTVAQGGAGAIAASAHLHTQTFAQVIAQLRSGNLASARELWKPLPQHISAMYAHPNPACIKAALARQGWICNELRAPMMAVG